MSDEVGAAQALEGLNVPVFLARATETGGGRLITLHTTERRSLSKIGARAAAAFARQGIEAKCKVVSHSARALARARSLESLSGRFGSGAILYDPTKFVARSELVVECARRIRAELGGCVENIALEARRRTLYVVVRDGVEGDAAADLVLRVGKIMRHWQATRAPGFALAVRIGTCAPRDARLVGVDDLSGQRTLRSRVFGHKPFARGAVAMGMAALFGASLAVPAAAEPAVSTPNLTLTTRLGAVDDDARADFGGKVALPFGEQFGTQLEVGVGSSDYYGFGGHLFWRDPDWAMFGGFVSVETSDNVSMTRFGAEAELYLDRFTLGGRVGSQEGDLDDGAFGRVDVSFYATPDLALRGGGEFTPNDSFGRAEVEWRPAIHILPQLSLFADGEFGDNDHESIMAGIRLHFGAPGVNLIDRDRREDPFWVIWNRAELVDNHPYGRGGGPIVLPDN
jgi:hypothetical protein